MAVPGPSMPDEIREEVEGAQCRQFYRYSKKNGNF